MKSEVRFFFIGTFLINYGILVRTVSIDKIFNMNCKIVYLISVLLLLSNCTSLDKDANSYRGYYLHELRGIDKNHKKMGEPLPGEWLHYRKESGQLFSQYIKSSPNKPDEKNNVIYIQPIGEFDSVEEKILKNTSAYIRTFFFFFFKLLDSLNDSVVPETCRRTNGGQEQLLTKYILYDILLKRIPADGVCYMAITAKDLYPADDWNFVFGQANIKKRVGVSSIFRLRSDDIHKSGNKKCQYRLLRTATHELAHMFSLRHCKDYYCLMNGSNSLSEADKKPLNLCSECMGKLMWCNRFDIIDRYNGLLGFYKESGMIEEGKYITDVLKTIPIKNRE